MISKYPIFILLVILGGSCKTSTQKPALETFQRILTDTSHNSRAKWDLEQLEHYNNICKEIGLNKLYDGVDSFEVRVWRQFSVFGIAADEEIYSLKLSDTNIVLKFFRVYCRQQNYDNEDYRHWNAFTNAKVDRFFAVSKTFPKSIVNSIELRSIWNLKTQSALNIPDSIRFLDGTTTSIEIASKTKYKLIRYHLANAYYEKTKIDDIKKYIDDYDRLISLFQSNKVYENIY